MGRADVHQRYLRDLAATFLLACLAGAGFNYLVDPYGLFGTRRVAGFNALKPASSERVRVIKPYLASRARPKAVIGGNSRVEIGLDPQSACWSPAERPVFNAGVPGADVFMQTRYVEHAVGRGKAGRVLFGVDFLDFVVDASRPMGRVDWDRLGSAFEGRLDPESDKAPAAPLRVQMASDALGGLFSLEALADSFLTIASQRDGESATRREDGFNPARDYRPIIRNEGQAVLFRQKNQEVGRHLRQDGRGVLDARGQPGLPLRALRRFLAWADARGVDVVLFIGPYHADYLAQIERSGKWPLFEAWERQLTTLAAEYEVPLWDFSAIDRYSTEPPPAPGDRRTELRWFWEPVHYRPELGEPMLAAMLARPCGTSRAAGAYGVELQPATVSRHLERLRADVRRYMRGRPQTAGRFGDSAP